MPMASCAWSQRVRTPALIDDAATVEDHDPVGEMQCRPPVRDEQHQDGARYGAEHERL